MTLNDDVQISRLYFSQNHEGIVRNFRDKRIASIQCLLDKMIYPQSIDITQFFRLNHSFKTGYEKIKEFIGPIIELSLQKKVIDSDYLSRITNCLECKGDLSFEAYELSNAGSPRTKLLLEGRLMDSESHGLDFRGKNVVVTGSDTGIGRETALEFARRGAKVAFHYPPDFETGALSAVELCQEYGKKADAFPGDFRNNGANIFANNALMYLDKKVDILMNNAGITFNKPFSEITEKELDEIYDVNIKSMFLLTQRIIKSKSMEKGGIIINMTSPHARAGYAGHTVYAGTKGAITSFTKALAMELAPDIRVNAVSPGGVATYNHFKLIPNFHEKGKNRPLRRWNSPKDIAEFIALLCSPSARNLTGQVIEYDCGMAAALSADINSTKVSDIKFGWHYVNK